MRHWLICVAAILVAGCTTPYEPPQIVGVQTFPGARSLAEKSGRVRVVMAHGMCSGLHKHYQVPDEKADTNWVAKRASLIAEAIGDTDFERLDYYKPTREYPDLAKADSAVQRIDMGLNGADGTRYDMSFLLWGDTFDKARDDIDSVVIGDVTGNLPKRGSLNATLKDSLMNDCFVDAVAYTGERGDIVRRNMRQALCELMGGHIKGLNSGRASDTVKCAGLSGNSGMPVMLVPESLGAKVLMDAFLALDDGAGGARKAEALGPVKAIHLATHQLPLLDTALLRTTRSSNRRARANYEAANRAVSRGQAPAIENPLNDFLRVVSNARSARSDPNPLSLVVYYDPNDMFGYPLTSSYLSPRLRVATTNMIVSNAPTFAGVASNPLKSHQNTARPGIAKIIINGSDALKD